MKPAILLAIFSFVHLMIFFLSGDSGVFWVCFLLALALTFNLAWKEES